MTPDEYLKIRDWLTREETEAKIARARMRLPKATEALFQLERALKAEATARVLRRVLKMLDALPESMREDESADPESENYIGHNRAKALGVAKCLCHGGKRDIMCPFHGR